MSRSTNYIPISDVLHQLKIISDKVWPSDAPKKDESAVIVNGDTFFDGRVNISSNLTVSGNLDIGAVEMENFTLSGGDEAWILRSDANSIGKWSKPYFKTNDIPLTVTGPSDDKVHTEYFVGIGITSPSVPLEVTGNTILGEQFIGNYNGSPTDTTIISHKSYKADNDGYAIKIKNDSQLDLNSKVDINFNISDSQVMTIDNLGNIGIGITQPNENLHVGGNVQIDGNLNVEGDLTYIKSTVVEVNDPNIFLARNNPSDVMDIGVFGQYVDNGVTKYTGIFRDASGENGYYNFFHNLEEKPTTTVNTSGTGYQNGNLHLGALQVDNGITFTTDDAFIYENNLILDSRSGDGTGMVGIGLTSAPLDSMDVNNGVIVRNGNLKIGITSSNASVHINRSDVIVIPIGTDNQRLDITGGIRYNTDNSTFEGFDGTWRSLGGVIDTDQDTKITAEDSAGIDNDQLRFYTSGLERMIINNDGNIGIGVTSSGDYKLEIDGSIGINGSIIPKTDGIYNLGSTSHRFGDLFFGGETIYLGDSVLKDYDGIFTVTGAVQMNELNITHNLDIDGNINVSGVADINNINITSNLDVLGIAQINDLNVTGNADIMGTVGIYNLNVTNNANIDTDLTVNGDTNITGSMTATSINLSGSGEVSGYLNLSGGVDIGGVAQINSLNVTSNASIDGDLTVDGNLTVQGTTTSINTEIVTIVDPIIALATNNSGNLVDIGFYGKYIETGVTKYTGLVKDASTNEFRLFTVEEEPTTIVNIGATSYLDAKLKLGDLDASGTVNIDSNLVIPVGDTSQRVDVTGAIRYNSEIATFEGYKGTWGSLGGVIDIDQDTYISAETDSTDNDELKFVTSGTERMIINSSGNIGIGTNIPTYPLQVEKINLNNWSTKIINSDTEVLIANTNGSALNVNSGVNSTNSNYIMNVKNNTNTSIFTIMNNENVGINNSNPLDKLDIATTSFSEGANIGYGFIGNSSNETTTTIFTHKDLKSNDNEYAIKQDSSGKTSLSSKTDLNLGINNVSKMIIKSDGKIGIHTLTPNAAVEIQEKTLINYQSGISLTVTNNLSDVYLANTDGSGILIESGTTSNYALECKENANPLFGVLNTGKVVIGITETDSKLSVEDNLTINHNDSYIKSNTTDSLNTINSNVPISLGVSANEILYINENKVSIDSNSINYQKFNVNGSQYISDSLLINTTQSNYQLDVSGNTNLNGDVLISGLLTFQGVAVDGLEFQDSLIKFGNNNTDNTEDIGFYGQYVDSLTTKYAGIVKDASDDKFKLFKDLETEPTTTVDLTDISYAYADLALNNLETSGNIGVNVVNPQYSLHINSTDAIIIPVGTNAQRVDVTGAIRYNSEIETFEGYKGTWGSLGGVIDVDQDTYISAETSAGIDNDELKFVTTGLQRMIIDSAGNVGIGITNPTYALDVNGIIQSNDEIFAPEFTTACDIRVKENIKRMNVDGILEKVNKLNLYEYNYVNGYNKSNDKIYGLIAQNVNEVMPEAIKLKKLKVGDKYIDDFQTISQNTLISSLIGCIHKLTDNQRDLGNELYQLKKDYYELKNSLILKNELNDLKK